MPDEGLSCEELVDLGNTPDGLPVEINRTVIESDRIIVTGTIGLHYFAGFGGGLLIGLGIALIFHQLSWWVLDVNTIGPMRAALGFRSSVELLSTTMISTGPL